MGTLITIVLALLIFGYGGYQAYQTIQKGSKGECHGCSCSEDCDKGSCVSSFGYVDLSLDDEDDE